MKQRLYIVLLALLALVLPREVRAQFHTNGVAPASVRWRSLDGGGVEVVAPDFAEEPARRLLFYMDSLTNTIGYGLGLGGAVKPLEMPVVLHSNTSLSNGISIMAPRRIEISTMPTTDSYATTWLRQLAVHEYRHSAQYAALFGGMAKWFYYALGEQALLAATGVMPFWWLEGDAVDAESQASRFGRALQPRFTIHYRSVGREILEGNPDVWFSGSYNRYTPSHYELGYQMVTTANALAGRYAWGEVMEYASRWPLTITPFEWGMRKYLNTSTEGLFRTTFERLNTLWESLPERKQTTTRVKGNQRLASTPYVKERYPMWTQRGTVVVVESSFDESECLVEVDPATGARRRLHNIGPLNTRPAIVGHEIYWSEMQQLSSFAQEFGSVMMCARLDGRGAPKRALPRDIYALYPTSYKGELAYVRYHLEGHYSVECGGVSVALPEGLECHGLAASGGRLYLLTTGDGGMSILSLDPSEGSFETIRPASYVTLSHLVADDNHLYFGSIASGYDEVHRLNLHTLREERLTTSRYGAFDGAPSPDGTTLALADYDQRGYHLAVSPIRGLEEIVTSELPRSVVNPLIYKWENIVCVDSLRYGPEQSADSHSHIPSRPFGKLQNLLEIHSWAPAYYRPDQLMAGNLSAIRIGATVTSQSLLSDALTTLGVYLLPGGSLGANVNFKYLGWVPKVELNALVDSRSAPGYAAAGLMMEDGDYYASYDHTADAPAPPTTRSNYSLYGRVYTPIVLSHSHITSVLTPSVEISHTNNAVYNPMAEKYTNGLTAVGATLQWNSYTRTAYRNLQPRWGVAIIGGVGKTITPIPTPTTVGLFARAYTPAFGRNDGFTLRASYQDICGSGPLGYSVDFGWLQPRGLRTTIYPDDQIGYSVQYNTPILYPDWGLRGIFLLKRISVGLFADGLYGRLWMEDKSRRWDGTTTFGLDLQMDTSWLRLPDQGDLTIRAGLYIDPRDPSHPTPSFGLNLNF
ncbi:MAG: hypothetical protein J6V28_05520 [Tidjanibacter sp.]|nr:hypothetical protein [Tidjanibacter sp.]